MEGPVARPGGSCPSAPPPSRLASLPMARQQRSDGDRLPERLQRSAACAAISLAPPSPAAPSALSMRLAEREPSTHPSERTRFTGARGSARPRTNEAGAEFGPAPRRHVQGLANGCLVVRFSRWRLHAEGPVCKTQNTMQPEQTHSDLSSQARNGLSRCPFAFGRLFIGNSRRSEFSRSRQPIAFNGTR